jgi:indolepyruvate ferredoxin oxidoreductase alpha subunit
MKRLFSGNEAIALGAWEAGVQYASAYPGTPSTEILENFARYPGIKAEWASNEKVALDNAIGASFGGARTLAVMKHVGVNVAADSLMSVSYTGVKGGLVLVSADDPGAFSSQNEQDNRQYARFGKFPCFDPSDSEDARRFVGVALDVSEKFRTPVMLRTTTRLSHSKSAVEARVPEAREFQPLPKFEREAEVTRVIIPAIARKRHPEIEQRLKDVAEWAETASINRIEWGDKSLGILTTGIAYQYAREVFAGYSILKLGMSYPLPLKLIRKFAEEVEQLIVVEELDPFIEDQLKALGIAVAHGKDVLPMCGELTLAKVRAGAAQAGLLPATVTSGVAPVDEVVIRHPHPAARVLPRLPASRLLLQHEPPEAQGHDRRRHRLLLNGRIAAVRVYGYAHFDGREHRHGPRLQASGRAGESSRHHRRQHFLPLRDGAAGVRHLQSGEHRRGGVR